MSHFPSEPTGPTSSSNNDPSAEVTPHRSSSGMVEDAEGMHDGSVAERLLTDLNDVRFRMTRRSAAGYDVAAVDGFVDELEAKVKKGESVLVPIQMVRFPMARRRDDGYVVMDVDSFLDRLEKVAAMQDGKLSETGVSLPDTSTRWLRPSNPVLWMALLGLVAVIVLYFL
ncbi:MAG: hypothetical protein Q4P15_11325 [Propionibacteriaceae bacterium]|nr:hypothetical protein [Propionibacteriaceae bacterium]